MNLKKEFTKVITDQLCISPDDLSKTEIDIIDISFSLFKGKLQDIKILEDEVKRLSVELVNLKSSLDDSNYEEE